jgi:hypothetical protein
MTTDQKTPGQVLYEAMRGRPGWESAIPGTKQRHERLAAAVVAHDRANQPAASGVARPLSDWHEDDGPVLWWLFPVDEAPWVGGPNDHDWPGYHTHWTALPSAPEAPKS